MNPSDSYQPVYQPTAREPPRYKGTELYEQSGKNRGTGKDYGDKRYHLYQENKIPMQEIRLKS